MYGHHPAHFMTADTWQGARLPLEMPSWFLWSPFFVLGPRPLEGRSVLLYTYICFRFELGNVTLWKGIIFQSFIGPQDISVHGGKEYPPFAAFQISSHSSHFFSVVIHYRGPPRALHPRNSSVSQGYCKRHSTPKRPPPLYMAWIMLRRS